MFPEKSIEGPEISGGCCSGDVASAPPSGIAYAAAESGIDPLLRFVDVPSTEKQRLFLANLDICCIVFDFTDHNQESPERELKRKTLLELLGFLCDETDQLSEPVIKASCKMFAINLFRIFPPKARSKPSRRSSGNGNGSGSSSSNGSDSDSGSSSSGSDSENGSSGSGSDSGENEEEDPILNLAWSQLQDVYNLLLRFMGSSSLIAKTAKKYVDQAFILRLLYLFDSEDPRERECLKLIVHKIYAKFVTHRAFIRRSISNIFFQFVLETGKHNGISELLDIIGSVICGFAMPLKEEHKTMLLRVLMPLHKPKSAGSYIEQLTFCLTQFISKDANLASVVIMRILKYWPVTNSQKMVVFLDEVAEVLETIDPVEFQKCMMPLFTRMGYCLNSPNFQVADRALFVLRKDHVKSLITQNRQAILPIIVPALGRNARHHWNRCVAQASVSEMHALSGVDPELFAACEKEFEAEEERSGEAERKRRGTWDLLPTVRCIKVNSSPTPAATEDTPAAPMATDMPIAADAPAVL